MTNAPTIPLALLAIELGADVDTLVRRLVPDSLLVDAVGFRCVERHVAARKIDEHRTRQLRNKQREAARRERLAEVSRRARATLRGGIPATADTAVLDLLAPDGDPHLEAAEDRLEGWLRGISTGARITPKGV